ncbi:S8 family serine peptidase [Olleya sp. Bg11-27]|uniref:S8 family serine peptidase n=1 Tax=Olleya sp. Bg11-27 TaxID=2058135 RepID=UPI000C316B0E|nr:S8 family serine peptidase [Olleya sp. Bg11-27]AUC77491.1 peptidase S8 [Olleya sp. Bg11-27]
MKKKILFAVALLIVTNIIAQTEAERQTIISEYNQSQIKALEKKIKQTNKNIQKEITDYVTTNNVDRKYTNEDGTLFEIKYILNNKPVYMSTDNATEAISTRTNFLHNGGGLGLNLEGQNMHVATWDGGPTLSTHDEFLDDNTTPTSRVTTPDSSASNGESNHSTHVSGTIIAKGTQASAKGMAPQATLTSFDWDNDSLEALNQATTNGLLLSNHSYGIPVSTNGTQNAPTWMMGCYNSDAVEWDTVAYNAPYYLMIASAGNDGSNTYTGGLANNYDKLTTNKNAKNNLVIANASNPLINPNGSGEMLNLFINTSSSQGPSDDGRVKPDITADGTDVYSPISTSNSSYDIYTGTSMSAPNTTGSLLLLQQYYNQLNSKYMKSATLKGLVCHTADDNTSSPGPDPIFGWGLLNSKVSAETIEQDATDGAAKIFESTLNNNDTFTTQVTIQSGQTLRATLCWTDPAGTAQDNQINSSTPALVNDLDLRITDASNSTFLPWKLQLSNVQGLAVKGDNLVDNIERVDINNAPAGTYTITINHKGTLTNALQNYSLIITGESLTSTLSTDTFKKESNLSVWPNPAKETLNYSFKSQTNGKVQISLTDIQGRIVFTKTPFESQTSIIEGQLDLTGYSKGLYFFNIAQGNSTINKKVIIK